MPSGPRPPVATLRQRLARAMRVDAGLPGPIRRPMRRTWIVLGLALAGVAAMVALDGLGMAGLFAAVLLGGLMLLVDALPGLGSGATSAVLDRAAAADHLLCPDCTYDLRTLDEAGACPECGRAYEHEAVRVQWVETERRMKHK